MAIKRHSIIGHTAYHDLLRLLRDQAVSDMRGKPSSKKVGGKIYWYDRYRLGDKQVETYLGEDSDELRQRIDINENLRAENEARGKECARLVRLLRGEGYLTPDGATGRIIAAMAKAGVFRLGGTIVGTHAFRAYGAELGVQIGAQQIIATGDIDITSFEKLSLVLNDAVDPSLTSVLSEFDFEPVPAMREGATWRWRQVENSALVEFLTPSFEEEEGLKQLAALGVSAQALHFMNYLIADQIPVGLLYRRGVLAQAPRPERFAVHKLIVADRRRDGADSLKAVKDRAQAAFLIDVLAEDRPDDIAEAFEDARDRGANWRKRLDATLKRMPETAAALASLP